MNVTRTPTVTDDRGITHRAATFRESRCPDPDDPRVRAMFARLRSRMAEATKGTSTVTWGLLATIAVFVAGTSGSIIATNYGSSRQLAAFLIGGIASAAGIGIGVPRHRAARNAVGDVTGELLFIARCPACAYRLGTAPRVDGIVTCSECGAAW